MANLKRDTPNHRLYTKMYGKNARFIDMNNMFQQVSAITGISWEVFLTDVLKYSYSIHISNARAKVKNPSVNDLTGVNMLILIEPDKGYAFDNSLNLNIARFIVEELLKT